MDLNNVIWSRKPADEWALGYPVGSGRIGAMVLGGALNERVGLNHDMLWRRYWKYQKHDVAPDLPEIRRLCAAGRWDDAHDLILKKIPFTGKAIYVNPFVPVGDLGIRPFHRTHEISDYVRCLNLDTGITEVEYSVENVLFKREYFCSGPAGVLVVRLSAERAGLLSGVVSLSRLLDPDCRMTGCSKPGGAYMEGVFEEGVRFAAALRIIQHGGRLTGGIGTYQPPSGEMPPKDLGGIQFTFRNKEEEAEPSGVTTCYDSADEVLILVAISTDNESVIDPLENCLNKLNSASDDFLKLKNEHITDHKKLYDRTSLKIGQSNSGIPTDELLNNALETGKIPPQIYELLFNMGRYLAISSGRPQKEGEPPKSPINLQGIWNQDRRPAWDCDYHLDLNLEMCYWPLELVNLGDLLPAVMDWTEGLYVQGRSMAKDLYGCRGLLLGGVNDNINIGNADNLLFCWTGSAAWLSQILWQHWEYSLDEIFLREKLYPFLKEIALFYEDFLTEDEQGRLVPCPSGSPEMDVKGRKEWSLLSSPSTIDLELIRDLFTHLLIASDITGLDAEKREAWTKMLQKVPLPLINKDGMLCEWLEEHEPGDPGHRHRSHLVGICPGDRITLEETPEYHEGVRKALDERHRHGRERTQSLTFTWDAQIYDRLYEAEESLKQLDALVQTNVMDNLLITCNDWRDRGYGLSWFAGTRVYQIETSICAVAAIAEMLFQDRRGLLRLLPALPKEWTSGSVRGLCGRGGFEVDIEWKDNRLHEARIKSLKGNVCRVKIFNADSSLNISCRNKNIDHIFDHDGTLRFNTSADETYVISGEKI